jgi:dipeptidyl aminopeptidase/acylaminoacyl peptidase
MTRRIEPYGTWRSPITAALAAAGAVRIGGVCLDGEDVYWLETRPAEGGRNALVHRRPDGSIEDVTPAGFSVRTRAHEYGGGAFVVAVGTVYFSNDADQRLWRQPAGGSPEPITPEGQVRYADAVVDATRGRLICVREDHRGPAAEPENALVTVPLAGGQPEVLMRGADFYAAPRLSCDGRRLAWLAWNHPLMPWEGTELYVAPLDEAGGLGAPVRVAGGERESIFQPAWAPDGSLHFVSDRSGWWNLYRCRDGADEALCPMEAEFGAPQWVFGLSTYGWVGPETIVCAHQREGTWRLGLLDTRQRRLTPIETGLTEIAFLQAAPERAVFAGASPAEPTGIYEVSVSRATNSSSVLPAAQGSAVLPAAHGSSVLPATHEPSVSSGTSSRLLHRPSRVPVDEAYLSRPEAVSFPTSGGVSAHGLYYPPGSPDFEGRSDERPPLIVMSHGGPTSAASTALSLPLQFWTSRGFAVLDVNYRGSSGYSRAVREALTGRWGLADVEDCIAGAHHLVARGSVDGQRLLIRGGSAGGYTTLCALVFHRAFRAGASYYGVSDLEALARDTHKLERHYLESLVGPYPARRDLYVARSPLHHVERLACPVIFFQGLEDKVVPPDQTERMVQALRGQGLAVEYVTFPNEQHGFRRAENVARALEAELAFYLRVLGLADLE